MGEIIKRARALRDAVMSQSATNFAPSSVWQNAYDTMLLDAITKIDDEREFIDFLTGRNTFTCPTKVADPTFRPVVDRYMSHFQRLGVPIGSLPAEIQESELVSESSATMIDGRRISTMFLHHLSEVLRIRKHVPSLRKVIEIGGGFGGQARLTRLFYPQQTYVIIDLLNSLYCSYVFVSTSFPQARILFVQDAAQVAELDNYDFVFVPTEHVGALKGIRTDLIVNTSSLGEMRQKDVDAYMQFINHDAETSYFYSVNRFARFEEWMSPQDVAGTSVKLSPDWEILFWDAFGERSFHQLDPVHPPQLELMVRKLTPDERLGKSRETIAGLLSLLADTLPRGGSDWHYCMWEAVRMFPSKPLIQKYIDGAAPDVFRDAAYYRELAASAPAAAPQLPQGIDLTARPAPAAAASKSIRQKIAELIR